MIAEQVKEKAREVRITPIVEDLAELKLSTAKKFAKDDNDVKNSNRISLIDTNAENIANDNVVKQLDKMFNHNDNNQSMLLQGKFQFSSVQFGYRSNSH